MKNMTKKIMALLICAAMLVSLCACVQEQTPAGDDPVTVDPGQTEATYCAPQTRIYTEGETSEFTRLVKIGSDGYEQNLVWWSCPVSDVKVIGITSSDAVEFVNNGSVIGEAGELAVGEALQIDLSVPEGMPNSAIVCSFGGVEHIYLLGYNGDVGGLSLMETTLSAGSAGQPDAQSTEIIIMAYYIDDNCEKLLSQAVTAESDSAWHVWAALKSVNTIIPTDCGLNSFTVDNNNIGQLDVTAEIMNAQLGGGGESLMLGAIANTYIKAYELDGLMITVDGGVYESGHIILDEALTLAE